MSNLALQDSHQFTGVNTGGPEVIQAQLTVLLQGDKRTIVKQLLKDR
jgi:hypothetical protein